MLTLGKINWNDVATWILGAVTVIAACYYFYLAFLKGRKRQASLIELLVLTLVIILVVLPIGRNIDFLSGQSLAGGALLVYLITRIFLFFK